MGSHVDDTKDVKYLFRLTQMAVILSSVSYKLMAWISGIECRYSCMALSQRKTQMFARAVMLQCLVRDRLSVMRRG